MLDKGQEENMKKLYLVSEAARITGLTSETLRHYDRIGLIKPNEKNSENNYRYYSEEDIISLNTIKALSYMDLSLKEIKEILSYHDFKKIVLALKEAEKNADNKIKELKEAKERIKRARKFYETKEENKEKYNSPFIKHFEERKILLAPFSSPSIDVLHNYHRHFFNLLPSAFQKDFSFKDLAGIYATDNKKYLYAECLNYKDINDERLITLPKGKYLCELVKEQDLENEKENLLEKVEKKLLKRPRFVLKLIVLTGILSWDYELEIFYE